MKINKIKRKFTDLHKLVLGIMLSSILFLCMATYIPLDPNLFVTGTLSAGNLNGINSAFIGLVRATNGFAGFSYNQQASFTISVGASPYTFSNTSTNDIVVWIGGGTLSAISINGTSTGLTGMTNGLLSIPLQMNDSVTVTYSASPTMTYHPFP